MVGSVNMAGLRLKELRMEKRYNQERMAMELNVSQASISAYENGDRVLSLDMAIKVCDYFDVSLDYLAGRTEARHSIHHEMTIEEETHLYMYHKLERNQRAMADAYVMGLAQRLN